MFFSEIKCSSHYNKPEMKFMRFQWQRKNINEVNDIFSFIKNKSWKRNFIFKGFC